MLTYLAQMSQQNIVTCTEVRLGELDTTNAGTSLVLFATEYNPDLETS